MQSIQISDELYRRFEKLGVPFVDTHESLMDRLISFGEIHSQSLQHQAKAGQARSGQAHSGQQLEFSFAEPPNVTYTRILGWTLDGRAQQQKTWNSIIEELLRHLHERNADILNQTSVNVKRGTGYHKGYKYIPKIGVSYQGLSAEDAFRAIKEFSEKYRLDISIHVIWLDKPNAQFPRTEAVISTQHGKRLSL